MTTKNNKKNKPHKFVLNLSQRLDLKISNKYAPQNISNNKSNGQWWFWITWGFLLKVRRSRFYRVHHKSHEKLSANPAVHQQNQQKTSVQNER